MQWRTVYEGLLGGNTCISRLSVTCGTANLAQVQPVVCEEVKTIWLLKTQCSLLNERKKPVEIRCWTCCCRRSCEVPSPWRTRPPEVMPCSRAHGSDISTCGDSQNWRKGNLTTVWKLITCISQSITNQSAAHALPSLLQSNYLIKEPVQKLMIRSVWRYIVMTHLTKQLASEVHIRVQQAKVSFQSSSCVTPRDSLNIPFGWLSKRYNDLGIWLDSMQVVTIQEFGLSHVSGVSWLHHPVFIEPQGCHTGFACWAAEDWAIRDSIRNAQQPCCTSLVVCNSSNLSFSENRPPLNFSTSSFRGTV